MTTNEPNNILREECFAQWIHQHGNAILNTNKAIWSRGKWNRCCILVVHCSTAFFSLEIFSFSLFLDNHWSMRRMCIWCLCSVHSARSPTIPFIRIYLLDFCLQIFFLLRMFKELNMFQMVSVKLFNDIDMAAHCMKLGLWSMETENIERIGQTENFLISSIPCPPLPFTHCVI